MRIDSENTVLDYERISVMKYVRLFWKMKMNKLKDQERLWKWMKVNLGNVSTIEEENAIECWFGGISRDLGKYR